MNKKYLNNVCRILPFVFLSVFVILLSLDCSNPDNPGKLNANIAPKTRLSNVPPLDVVSKMDKPRVTLNWVGDDPDGYVIAYRYTWTYPENGVQKSHPFKYILNIIVEEFALMVETQDKYDLKRVYKYFSTLNPDVGLDQSLKDSLARGDSIWIQGVRIYASNPDSIKIQTGERIKYLYPIHENPNSGTFIFDSPDSINFHTFLVAAIDNDTAVSSGATVSFETPSVVAPHTSVISYPTSTMMVISESTATFRGIEFTFQGIDPNSRTIDYRWVVDKDKWLEKTGSIPWSEFTFHEYAWVQASDFPDPYDSSHTFYVQARNEFGAIDTIGYFTKAILDSAGDSTGFTADSAWVNFKTSYPRFKNPNYPATSKILLINNSVNGNSAYSSSPAFPYRSTLDSFYVDLLTNAGVPRSDIDIVHVGARPPDGIGFPSREVVSDYPYLFMYGDIVTDWTMHLPDSLRIAGSAQGVIRDYCYVGGRIIIGGWGLMNSFNMIPDEEFAANILHIDLTNADPITGKTHDCIGANGFLGYPDLRLDTTKLDTSWHGALSYIYKDYPAGFGEITQKYASLTANSTYEQIPISIRYKGITFNTIFFGVPLYYMQRPGADSAIAVAIRDLKDNTYIHNGTK
jgi:hypothetical protein